MPVGRRVGECALPTSIGSHTWLGAGVIVYPGVTIGENTVIGAGSVVTRDVPDPVGFHSQLSRGGRGTPCPSPSTSTPPASTATTSSPGSKWRQQSERADLCT
ncbi:DapH/DapD/GlmU-related protein [Allosaccharopolyspora coralli]|uniref:DapH/DapD/GlmU-related protein n=1 Tax=Allosaccharopolyspora coralli TaxID=2665642 RepID=UPI001E45525C|nr:DapH/DapD/GlmU-related protein [Allosaccharopolyspora coralli]